MILFFYAFSQTVVAILLHIYIFELNIRKFIVQLSTLLVQFSRRDKTYRYFGLFINRTYRQRTARKHIKIIVKYVRLCIKNVENFDLFRAKRKIIRIIIYTDDVEAFLTGSIFTSEICNIRTPQSK